MSFTLRDYQRPHFARLLRAMLSNGFAHDGSETGTGKTYVGAAMVKAFEEETLIVSPLSVIPDWREALEGFGAKNYTLMNYEKVWRRLGKVRKWGTGSFFQFDRAYPNILFDESHRCGGETTINSKMVISAKRAGSRILSLSATVAETPLRMKAFGYAAGLHNLTDYTEFLQRCQCKPGTFGGWTFSAKAHPLILQGLSEEIYLKGRGSRMRIKDIPGFPDTLVAVRLLGCPDKQLLKMGEELRSYYNDRTVAAHKLEESLRLKKKIAEELGEEMPSGGEEFARMLFLRQALEAAKVPALIEMTEDALETSKVVVFCNFRKTISDLVDVAKKHGWKYGIIQGGQTTGPESEREAVKKAFQRNELDVVFCNIDAGGEAVSLHDPFTQYPRTTLICPTFSGRALKQVLGRVRRESGGFSRQLLVYFEDSIEGQIARAVKNKLNAIDLINDAELSGNFQNAA